jgi:hypothetical protein
VGAKPGALPGEGDDGFHLEEYAGARTSTTAGTPRRIRRYYSSTSPACRVTASSTASGASHA